MRVGNNYKPYKKHWFDCEVNNILSILSSLDPSYEELAVCNFFVYKNGGGEGWMNGLDLINGELFRTYTSKVKKTGITRLYPENILEQIKNLISSDRNICVSVDGYNWLKGNMNWHKNHIEHYVFLTGYDDEKQVLYTFDDDKFGYNEFEVPYKIALESLKSCNKYKMFEYLVEKDIKEFAIKIEDIIYSAKCIRNSIANVSFCTIWCDYGANDFNYFISNLTRICNRLVTTEELFDLLCQRGYLTKECSNQLKEEIHSVSNSWQGIRTSFIMESKLHKRNDYRMLNDKSYEILKSEYELWKKFELNVQKGSD